MQNWSADQFAFPRRSHAKFCIRQITRKTKPNFHFSRIRAQISEKESTHADLLRSSVKTTLHTSSSVFKL